MEDCIFCKIVNGEIPAHKIYEDDLVIVFLDVYPAAEGHTLLIPKHHDQFIWEMDDNTYSHLMNTVHQVANRIIEKLNPLRVGMAVDGGDVPHAHLHLIPLNKGLTETLAEKSFDVEPDHARLANIAEKLKFE